VWAWGYNGQGQLGSNSTVDSLVPVQVVGPDGQGFLNLGQAGATPPITPEQEAPVRADPVVVTPTPGIRNAIVITHGWNASADTWVYEMAKAVCSHIPGIPLYDQSPIADDIAKICHTADWDVWVRDWRFKADTGLTDPWEAYGHFYKSP
jgi:hypothetical protein